MKSIKKIVASALCVLSLSANAQPIMRIELTGDRKMDILATLVTDISWYSSEAEEIRSSTQDMSPSGAIAVDLGLPSGTLWANMNIGAESPEGYGDYFAWGETKPYYTEGHSQDSPCSDWKTDKWGYTWSSYCYGDEATRIEKYCTNIDFSSWGLVDYKIVLEESDDAAHVNWGGSWRMPTIEELDELYTECTWESTEQNGVNGYQVISKSNGNSIFLPAAGCRNRDRKSSNTIYYWSSSLDIERPGRACYFLSNSEDTKLSKAYRYVGQSVRAVKASHTSAQIIMRVELRGGKQMDIPVSSVTRISWCSDGSDESSAPEEVEAVDLALPSGTLWANMNIGAESPEDFGDYFAWGETKPYYAEGHSQDDPCTNWNDDKTAGYSWNSYQWCNGSDDSMTKYCTDDNKTILELEDDAANVNWGEDWRMPTKEELDELRFCCIWTWTTTKSGVLGYTVTSKKNGNSIFIPAAGYREDDRLNNAFVFGYYWSSTPFNVNTSNLQFGHTGGGSNFYYRCAGLPVRAVQSRKPDISPKAAEPVDLGLPSGIKWANMNVGAESPEDYGDYFAWGETIGYKGGKTNFSQETYKYYGETQFTDIDGFTTSTFDFTKYVTNKFLGSYDGKTVLTPKDDAATVNWGGDWRMPTRTEISELLENCWSSDTTQNGVRGLKCISKINGNSIFLPLAGYRNDSELSDVGLSVNYLSSMLAGGVDYFGECLGCKVLDYGDGVGMYNNICSRYSGFSVRPVCP